MLRFPDVSANKLDLLETLIPKIVREKQACHSAALCRELIQMSPLKRSKVVSRAGRERLPKRRGQFVQLALCCLHRAIPEEVSALFNILYEAMMAEAPQQRQCEFLWSIDGGLREVHETGEQFYRFAVVRYQEGNLSFSKDAISSSIAAMQVTRRPGWPRRKLARKRVLRRPPGFVVEPTAPEHASESTTPEEYLVLAQQAVANYQRRLVANVNQVEHTRSELVRAEEQYRQLLANYTNLGFFERKFGGGAKLDEERSALWRKIGELRNAVRTFEEEATGIVGSSLNRKRKLAKRAGEWIRSVARRNGNDPTPMLNGGRRRKE
jgi:hypothetical protein